MEEEQKQREAEILRLTKAMSLKEWESLKRYIDYTFFKNMPNLKKIILDDMPTSDLIKELEGRAGIEKASIGLYASYELRKKYARHKSTDGIRGNIIANTVLAVNPDVLDK